MLQPHVDKEDAVEFVALIYHDPDAWEALPAAAREDAYARYIALYEDGSAAGVVRGGEELESGDAATTVRIREARTLVADGPYAETKEVLGGFYVFDCASFEEGGPPLGGEDPRGGDRCGRGRAVHVTEEAAS